jgi:DNA-binding CsgD family transcriptional regulator
MTPAERRALMLAARGWTTFASARYLGVSEKTVKCQLATLRAKLGAQNTTHAVVLALSLGLVTMDALTFDLAELELEEVSA